MCGNGLSFGAFAKLNSSEESLVGCLIAEDFASEPPSVADDTLGAFLRDYGESWECVFAILDDVEDQVKRDYCSGDGDQKSKTGELSSLSSGEEAGLSLPEPNQVCHLWCVAVSREVRGRRIAEELTRLCAEQAQKEGYRLSFAECTGVFSRAALLRSGFEPAGVFEYDEWEYPAGSGKRPLAGKIPAPHTACTLVVKHHDTHGGDEREGLASVGE
jgi:ribosomal protein S18 acetylase RimI-like enzyme